MKITNTRKLGALALIAVFLGSLTFTFQNFTVNESSKTPGQPEQHRQPSLNDALSAALKSAEADTTAKQIALSVEPTQIEKSSFKKHREPRAIIDNTESLTETDTNWVQKESTKTHEVEDSIDSEINDNTP